MVLKKSSVLVSTLLLVIFLIMVSGIENDLFAQQSHPYVRIANIIVDSAQLDNYNIALKEHAAAAVSKEPGVLTLYAVYDKQNPTHITVFEIYASMDAYRSHITTSHFLKYKNTVKDMVKSLVLTDVEPIALEQKPNLKLK